LCISRILLQGKCRQLPGLLPIIGVKSGHRPA
jgi:hypothetical protein